MTASCIRLRSTEMKKHGFGMKRLGSDDSDLVAPKGFFRSVVTIDGDRFQAGLDVPTREEAREQVLESAGFGSLVQVYDQKGVPHLNEKGELLRALDVCLLESKMAADAHKKIMAEIWSNIAALVKASPFTCEHCKVVSPLGACYFVQNHWYEGPHGCAGGACWHGTKVEGCHVACPSCGKQNYIYNHRQRAELQESIGLLEKRELFAKVYDSYKYDDGRGEQLTQVHPDPSLQTKAEDLRDAKLLAQVLKRAKELSWQ